MSATARIGMFGGTFDPPHVGHRIVAADVVTALELDRLLVVPAARPPHRGAALDARTRLALTRGAFADDPRIVVSDVEFDREGPSYTVDTLERIRAEYPGSRLFLVVGSDQYEGLGGWHRPERIVELAELAVMRRSDRSPASAGFPHVPVNVTRVDLSSTAIRARLEAGQSIRYLVPDAILEDVTRAWAARATNTERATDKEARC